MNVPPPTMSCAPRTTASTPREGCESISSPRTIRRKYASSGSRAHIFEAYLCFQVDVFPVKTWRLVIDMFCLPLFSEQDFKDLKLH